MTGWKACPTKDFSCASLLLDHFRFDFLQRGRSHPLVRNESTLSPHVPGWDANSPTFFIEGILLLHNFVKGENDGSDIEALLCRLRDFPAGTPVGAQVQPLPLVGGDIIPPFIHQFFP